jgi:hypothetical protein
MSKPDKEHGRSGLGAGVTGTSIVNSVDQLIKLPLQMTGATWDFMMQGMRNMTGTGHQPRTAEPNTIMHASSNGLSLTLGLSDSQNPQDLGGDELKYITWSLIFTKPGHECVLEPPTNELVTYAADASSFAGVKIAKFLEKARHGHVEKAESWRDQKYPPEHAGAEHTKTEHTKADHTRGEHARAEKASTDRGWRIPAEDHKYLTFLHRVEWRLPKQEDVKRTERLTIEHGTTRIA